MHKVYCKVIVKPNYLQAWSYLICTPKQEGDVNSWEMNKVTRYIFTSVMLYGKTTNTLDAFKPLLSSGFSNLIWRASRNRSRFEFKNFREWRIFVLFWIWKYCYSYCYSFIRSLKSLTQQNSTVLMRIKHPLDWTHFKTIFLLYLNARNEISESEFYAPEGIDFRPSTWYAQNSKPTRTFHFFDLPLRRIIILAKFSLHF